MAGITMRVLTVRMSEEMAEAVETIARVDGVTQSADCTHTLAGQTVPLPPWPYS